MMSSKTTYDLRWTWHYHNGPSTFHARLKLGLGVQAYYDFITPDHRPLSLMRVNIHLLVGTLSLTIQFRPLAITDLRPKGGSNA